MSKLKTYEHPLNEILEASIKALRNCGFKITDNSKNTIKASSGFSLRSFWGANIEIRLSSTLKGVKVKATSTPQGQLFDLGKSTQNVSRFFSELDRNLDSK